jgi:hypothetical protein
MTESVPILTNLDAMRNAAEIKSTTEINLIIQQRLDHASVDQLLSNNHIKPSQIAQELLDA